MPFVIVNILIINAPLNLESIINVMIKPELIKIITILKIEFKFYYNIHSRYSKVKFCFILLFKKTQIINFEFDRALYFFLLGSQKHTLTLLNVESN